MSQYRLAAHLFAASLLFIALIWVARRLEPARAGHVAPGWPVAILLLLILLQIVAGAFVAGLDAGMGYNTWPLMDGAWIPTGLDAIEPFWKNLFENALTVQFIHRCIAYLIVLYVGWLLWRQAKRGGFGGVHGWLPRIAAAGRAAGGAGHWHARHARADLAGARPPGPGVHAGRCDIGVSGGSAVGVH